MKCKNCPFSLICYTRRFIRVTVQGAVYLCPTCGKLIYRYGDENGVIYAFFCLRYKMSSLLMEQWLGRPPYATGISIYDPYNNERISIMRCAKCTNKLSIFYNLTWIELE